MKIVKESIIKKHSYDNEDPVKENYNKNAESIEDYSLQIVERR